MKIGFFSACLGKLDLPELLEWASKAGFQALEPSCASMDKNVPWQGGVINVSKMTGSRAGQIKELFAKYDMEISCLTGCVNNLSPDPSERKRNHQLVRNMIRAARLLELDCISTFVGRDPAKTTADNLKEYRRVFKPLAKLAGDNGVKIAFENCPMPGWQFEGLAGNIAYAPSIWEDMFDVIPDLTIGLNYDPSHCYWLGIDYLAVIEEFAERIFHVHAKDTEVMDEALAWIGILPPRGWWRYRMPGMGEIDWAAFVSALAEMGYDGAVSIEHEDPVWHGSVKKVKEGLILGRKHLSQFII